MLYHVITAHQIVKHVLLQEVNVKFAIQDIYYKDKDVCHFNKQIALKQVQVEDVKFALMDFIIIMDSAYNVLIHWQDLFAILINNTV